jgi:hypothetical protein
VQILEGVLVRTVFVFFPHIINVDPRKVKNSVKTSLARIPLRWMIRECFKTNTGILFRLDLLKTVNLDAKTLHPTVSLRPVALPLTTLPSEEMYIKRQPMNPEERVTKPGPFAWLSALFKKTPAGEGSGSGSADAEHVGDKDDKGPADSEELADLKDSLAPVYDQLELKRIWWIAEYIPFKQRYQQVDSKKLDFHPEPRKMNKGRGRKFPKYKEKERDLVRVHRSVKTRMEASYRNGDKYVPKVVNFEEERVVWVD